jgi:hypothetical protein
MAELQEARNYLLSEGERIEQETIRYANLTQMASDTAKIIVDAVSQWHPASNQRKSNASEVTATSTEDNIGAFRKSHDHSQRTRTNSVRRLMPLRDPRGRRSGLITTRVSQ